MFPRNLVLKFIVFFITFLAIANVSLAQKSDEIRKEIKHATHLFDKQRYHEALKEFQKIDKSNHEVEQHLLDYKIGLCYYNIDNEREQSIDYFEKYIAQDDSIYEVHYFLAKMLHFFHRFDEAIEQYENFHEYILKDESIPEEEEFLITNTIDNEIQRCNYGKSLMAVPVEVIIENLGEDINTEYREYAPVISNDETKLVFTRRSPENTGGKTDYTGEYFDDIYITDIQEGSLFKRPKFETMQGGNYYSALTQFKFTKPRRISNNINTATHEGAVQFSGDNSKLYIYRNYNIFVSENEGKSWAKTHLIEEFKNVLDARAFEPSFSLSSDEQTFFFSSDRPGGYGDLDIYKSEKREDGTWGAPVNLGPAVNTTLDEDGPYVDPNGRTLYFSSKGHSSMGGFDVFKTSFNGTEWTAPQNMGFPINSAGNDIFYMMTPLFNRAYYSSNKYGGYGGMDLYRLTFADERTPLAEIKGVVVHSQTKLPGRAKITVFDAETSNDLYSLYSDSLTGEYLLPLGHGNAYTIKVDFPGFSPYEKVFEIPSQVYYYQYYQEVFYLKLEDKSGEIIGQKVEVLNAFFDVDSAATDITEKTKASGTAAVMQAVQAANKLDKLVDLDIEDLVDVKFYIPESELIEKAKTDPSLHFDFPAEANISFMPEIPVEDVPLEDMVAYVPAKNELPRSVQKPITHTRQAVLKINNVLVETEAALLQTQKLMRSTSVSAEAKIALSKTNEYLIETRTALKKTQAEIAKTNDGSKQTAVALKSTQQLLEKTKSELNVAIKEFENSKKNSDEDKTIELVAELLKQSSASINESDQLLVEVNSKMLSPVQLYTEEYDAKFVESAKNAVDKTEEKLIAVAVSPAAKKAVAETNRLLKETKASLMLTEDLLYGYLGPTAEAKETIQEARKVIAKTQNSLAVTQLELLKSDVKDLETEKVIRNAQEYLASAQKSLIKSEARIESAQQAENIQEARVELNEVYDDFSIIQDLSPQSHESIRQTRNLLVSTLKELEETEKMLGEYQGADTMITASIMQTKALVSATQSSLAKIKSLLTGKGEYSAEVDKLVLGTKGLLAKTQASLAITQKQIVLAKKEEELITSREQLIEVQQDLVASANRGEVSVKTAIDASELILRTMSMLEATDDAVMVGLDILKADMEESNVAEIKAGQSAAGKEGDIAEARLTEAKESIKQVKEMLEKEAVEKPSEKLDSLIAKSVGAFDDSQASIQEVEKQIVVYKESALRTKVVESGPKDQIAESITTAVKLQRDLHNAEGKSPESTEKIRASSDLLSEVQESLVFTESLLYDFYGPTTEVRNAIIETKSKIKVAEISLAALEQKLKEHEEESEETIKIIEKLKASLAATEGSLHEIEVKLAGFEENYEVLDKDIDLAQAEKIIEKTDVSIEEAHAEVKRDEIVEKTRNDAVAVTDAVTERTDEETEQDEVAAEKVSSDVVKEKDPSLPISDARPTIEPLPNLIVYFDYDNHGLSASSKQKLNTLKSYMKNNPDARFKVVGHTDSRGASEYNKQLSKRRADTVIQYVAAMGMSVDRLSAVGRGEEQPIAPNATPDGSDNPEGRKKNRRVEFEMER